MKFPKPKIISFRNEVLNIENNGYLTHSLYYHPAKFIPQVVRYCLDNYCKKNSVVLDPFAGSGTTGLEASINKHQSYLLDINPLLVYYYPIKMPDFSLKEWWAIYQKTLSKLEKISNHETTNKVKYDISNLEYWYPPYLLNYFSTIWGNLQNIKTEKLVKSIISLILFKISKKYSYAEHSMPKLFTSKRKRESIDKIKNKNELYNKIRKELFDELNKINKSVTHLLSEYKLNKINYYAGTDAYEFNYNKLPKIDCIITSPPYMQAQEYIRTFKLEMFWLGYSKEQINTLTKKEIPFREPEGQIDGEYINTIRNKITSKNLLKIYDSYFWFTIKTLEKASERIKRGGHLCVFIGNPKVNGIEVEIWKVIYEYFTGKLNYKFISVFDDRIVSRKLFRGRKNQNPNGMQSEFLLVLEKK